MRQRRKVILVGIDSGEKSLVMRWSAEGLLPNLRTLMAGGLAGHTMSVPGLYVGATWECFSTGASPAGTGVYSWKQLVPGSYRFIGTRRGDHLKVEPFWIHLGRNGRRVAVIDVPHSTPAAAPHGMQLVDWGAHAASAGFAATPKGVAERIRQRYGEHPARAEHDRGRTPAECLDYRDRLLDGIRRKTRLSLDLLAEDDWDLFLDVFTEAHSAGHHLWHMHDPTHPRHDPALAATHGDPIRDVYRALDRAVGRLRAAAGERTVFIVFFSHGMGPEYGAAHMLDDILLRLGVARGPAARPARPLRRWLEPPMIDAWHCLPAALRDRARMARELACRWLDSDVGPGSPAIDPAASLCFPLGDLAAHVGVRVNLAGREPAGRVQPARNFDLFCRDLSADLLDIVDLDTGRPVVQRVIRTDTVYAGRHLDVLPDLLIEWQRRTGATTRISSPKFGELRRDYVHCRTGDHTPEGLFVADGPGIRPGVLGRTISVMDFAPTIADLLDVPFICSDGIAMPELTDVPAGLAAAVQA